VSDPQAPVANYEAVVKELQAQLAATHAAIRALPDQWRSSAQPPPGLLGDPEGPQQTEKEKS